MRLECLNLRIRSLADSSSLGGAIELAKICRLYCSGYGTVCWCTGTAYVCSSDGRETCIIALPCAQVAKEAHAAFHANLLLRGSTWGKKQKKKKNCSQFENEKACPEELLGRELSISLRLSEPCTNVVILFMQKIYFLYVILR